MCARGVVFGVAVVRGGRWRGRGPGAATRTAERKRPGATPRRARRESGPTHVAHVHPQCSKRPLFGKIYTAHVRHVTHISTYIREGETLTQNIFYFNDIIIKGQSLSRSYFFTNPDILLATGSH